MSNSSWPQQPHKKVLFGKVVEEDPTESAGGDEEDESLQPSGVAISKMKASQRFLAKSKGLKCPLGTAKDDQTIQMTSTVLSPTSESATIICKSLPENLTNEELRSHFSRFGNIKKMNMDSELRTASVTFYNASEATVAKEMGSKLRDGRTFNVYKKSTKPKALVSKSTAKSEGDTGSAISVNTAPPRRTFANDSPTVLTAKPCFDWVPSFVRIPPNIVSIFQLAGRTAQERAHVLEKADKVIYDLIAASESKREGALVGTCDDMCPERERYDREFQRRLSRFEILDDNVDGTYAIDHKKALKEYARSAADQREPLPYELRTPEALINTMMYLLTEICPKADQYKELADWADWYHFLWTRTRGIRKDITQQHLISEAGISLLERCARFHAFCAERLAELPNTAGFDQKLNSQNLTKCLQSLKEMYSDLRQTRNVGPDDNLPELKNEAEFTGYRILMKLDEGAILT